MPWPKVIPRLLCHLCLDMVDLGILDPEEARPAVVVYPTKGSLCDWHRIKAAMTNFRLGPGEGRERYRAALIDDGFLPRDAVLTHIVTNTEPGTVEQVREGLLELAEKDYGDCNHPVGGTTTPDRCVRCMARRFLVLLDSSVGWRQTIPSTTGDPG